MGLPHFTLDLRAEFRAGVVDPFLASYAGGETPNPCVRCNGHVRLDAMLEFADRVGAATLATGLVNATLPRFLDEQLGLGARSYGFGLAALAAGLVVGQALVGFARLGSGGGRWIGCGLVLMAALFVALALTDHAPTAVLLLGLIGLVDGTTDVLFDTVVQREADPRYYGRVFGFASAFMMTTMMGAVGVAPLVNRIALPRELILTAGLFLLAAATIALVGSPGRASDPVDLVRPDRTKAAA
jgi:MFS family permease